MELQLLLLVGLAACGSGMPLDEKDINQRLQKALVDAESSVKTGHKVEADMVSKAKADSQGAIDALRKAHDAQTKKIQHDFDSKQADLNSKLQLKTTEMTNKKLEMQNRIQKEMADEEKVLHDQGRFALDAEHDILSGQLNSIDTVGGNKGARCEEEWVKDKWGENSFKRCKNNVDDKLKRATADNAASVKKINADMNSKVDFMRRDKEGTIAREALKFDNEIKLISKMTNSSIDQSRAALETSLANAKRDFDTQLAKINKDCDGNIEAAHDKQRSVEKTAANSKSLAQGEALASKVALHQTGATTLSVPAVAGSSSYMSSSSYTPVTTKSTWVAESQ